MSTVRTICRLNACKPLGSACCTRRVPHVVLVSVGLAIVRCPVGIDPRVNLVGHFGQELKVVAPEPCGLFPDITVSIKSNNADCVSFPGLGLIAPDAGLDHSKSNGVYWFGHGDIRCVVVEWKKCPATGRATRPLGETTGFGHCTIGSPVSNFVRSIPSVWLKQ